MQAGFFQQVAKDELSPVALGLGRAAQRRGKVLCLGGKLLVEPAQIADQAFEPCDACLRVGLRLLHLLAEFLDLVLEWVEQRAQLPLAAF